MKFWAETSSLWFVCKERDREWWYGDCEEPDYIGPINHYTNLKSSVDALDQNEYFGFSNIPFPQLCLFVCYLILYSESLASLGYVNCVLMYQISTQQYTASISKTWCTIYLTTFERGMSDIQLHQSKEHVLVTKVFVWTLKLWPTARGSCRQLRREDYHWSRISII